MKRNKIISLSLTLMLTVGCAMPGIVNAATDASGNSKETVTPQEVSEASTQNVSVDASVASEFSVSVPKTIQLDGSRKSATYKVTCNGDFPANKKVTVTPAANVTLSSVNKDNVVAIISQDKTEWRYDDSAEANGTITAEGLTAGIWDGIFNFNIAFADTECGENEHDWEYETVTEDVQVLVKDAWDETVKEAWDEEKPYDVVVCNQCGMEFSELDYNGFEGALDAMTNHIFDSWDNGGNCDNYRNETRTIKVHHEAEIVHHPAQYETQTVETKVSRTCRKCQKHQERAEFEDEIK